MQIQGSMVAGVVLGNQIVFQTAYQLRQASADDAGHVTDLWIGSRRAAQPMIPAAVHSDGEVFDWIASIVIPRQETWLAEAHSQVIGMMSLTDGWIDQLHLDPDWTGRGVGSALIRLAQERYPQGLQLWTFESNRGAQRLYERHGFVASEKTGGGHNEEQSPDIRYVWGQTRMVGESTVPEGQF